MRRLLFTFFAFPVFIYLVRVAFHSLWFMPILFWGLIILYGITIAIFFANLPQKHQ